MKRTRLDLPPARTKKMVRARLGALVRTMYGEMPEERLACIVQLSVDSGAIEGYADMPEDVMSADDLRAEIRKLERDARG